MASRHRPDRDVRSITGGGADGVRTLILTWRPDDDGGDDELEPDPQPRTRVLETQS